ncbi:hypothetical protein KCU99_g9407, partial [Aureobasidium melanogenum]
MHGSLFAVFLSGEPSDRKWLHCILSQPVDNACKTDGGGVINTTVTSVEPMNDIVVFEIVLYGQQSRLLIHGPFPLRPRTRRCKNKTYSSRDSHVVTHRSTNLPFNCLCMAERTGCPVFS